MKGRLNKSRVGVGARWGPDDRECGWLLCFQLMNPPMGPGDASLLFSIAVRQPPPNAPVNTLRSTASLRSMSRLQLHGNLASANGRRSLLEYRMATDLLPGSNPDGHMLVLLRLSESACFHHVLKSLEGLNQAIGNLTPKTCFHLNLSPSILPAFLLTS